MYVSSIVPGSPADGILTFGMVVRVVVSSQLFCLLFEREVLQVVSVDGVPCHGLPTSAVDKLIVGEEGSFVQLLVSVMDTDSGEIERRTFLLQRLAFIPISITVFKVLAGK